MYARERPGVVNLITEALGQSADLIQTEMRLARAEISEKAVEIRNNVVAGLAMMLVGMVFLVGALVLFSQAVVAALVAAGMAPHWAIILTAGASAAGGVVLVMAGKKQFGNLDPVPDRTVRSLKRDADMAKETLT